VTYPPVIVRDNLAVAIIAAEVSGVPLAPRISPARVEWISSSF
jgi:hypothetical protein